MTRGDEELILFDDFVALSFRHFSFSLLVCHGRFPAVALIACLFLLLSGLQGSDWKNLEELVESRESTNESEEVDSVDASLEDPLQENTILSSVDDALTMPQPEIDSDASDGLSMVKTRWQKLRKSPRVHGIVGGIQEARKTVKWKAIKESPPVNGIIGGIQDARKSVQKLLARAMGEEEDADGVCQLDENEILDFPLETSPTLSDSPSVDEIMHGIESALDRGHELMAKIKADAKSAGLDFD